MSSALLRQPTSATTFATSTPSIPLTAADAELVKQAQRLGKADSLREFGYLVVNSLCNQLRCEQIGMGVVRDRAVEVIALSGCTDVKSCSPGVFDMRQAMEECLDRREVIAYPEIGGINTLPLHKQWSISSGNAQVCSLPLTLDEKLVGILSFRQTSGTAYSEETISQIHSNIRPFGALLSLIERANRPLRLHLRIATREWVRRRSNRVSITLFATFLLFALWFCFGQVCFRPLCSSLVVPAELRNVTAPFESRLDGVYVRAGSQVSGGDILVEFDTTSLKLKLEGLRAEIAQNKVRERAAIEAGDATVAALQQASRRVLIAEQRSIERLIDGAVVVAPADGTIIRCSLEKKLGQVFAQGDPVLQFAPDSGWFLDIRIPESVAVHIEPGQAGAFASTARPNDKVEFNIEQVDGSASIIDGKNVFVARANLKGAPKWLRSGMNGFAQIDTVSKPVWWVALHRVLDWTRMRFWL